MVAKRDAVDGVLKKLQGIFNEESVRTLDGMAAGESIPTGIAVLDNYIFGCGGMPVGKIVELFSDEGAGKSSLVYAIIGAAQRAGCVVALCDTEYSVSADRAAVFGAEPHRVIHLEPEHMEDCLHKIEAFIDALPTGGPPALLAWDSIAATPTAAEVESGAAPEKSFDVRAKLLSQSCRVLLRKAAAKRCALLFVNQTRMKIGVMFGDPTTTPGGQAIKFASSIRLQLWAGKKIDGDGEKLGQYVTVGVKKSRYAPPRKAKLRLDYATGWNDDWAVLDLAKELKLIPASSRGAKGLEEAWSKLGWPRAADKPVNDAALDDAAPADDTTEATDDE